MGRTRSGLKAIAGRAPFSRSEAGDRVRVGLVGTDGEQGGIDRRGRGGAPRSEPRR